MDNIYGIDREIVIKGTTIIVKVNNDYKKSELEFAFYIYLNEENIYQGKYSSKKHIEFKIDKLGKYIIRTFVKQKNENYKKAYSLYDEVDYSVEAVVKSLLNQTDVLKKKVFFKKKDDIVEKEYFNEKIELILSYINDLKKSSIKFENDSFMLSSILSLGGNIFEYLKNIGYENISIYSDSFIGVCLYIVARFSGYGIKLLMGPGQKNYIINIPSSNTIVSFLNYTASKELNENDAIIVTSKYNNKIDRTLKSFTKASILYWDQLALNCFTDSLIVEQFKDIKEKNPGVKIMICNNPGTLYINSPSEHEKNIDSFLPSIKQYVHSEKLDDPVFGKNGFDIDYVKEVTEGFSLYYDKNNITHYNDRNGKYVNIVGGQRVTTDLPNKFKGTIYMFGSSVCLGTGTDDSNTIASCLQRLLNKKGILYAVQNCSNYSASDDDRQMALMKSMSFNSNDIIISMLRSKERIDAIKECMPFCDVIPIFNRPHNMGEVFIDQSHINFIGNQRIAKTLYDFLIKQDFFKQNNINDLHIQKIKKDNCHLSNNEESELNLYVSELKRYANLNKSRIGAVVVNCNPFTLGHRYLIEKAASEVTHLYVFVVEEDKSMFPFKDRIELVKQGIKDIKNVTVFPSGKFIISTRTFAAYSNKDKLQNNTIDASTDVKIFAEYIAPSLGITIRFAGEEPLCNVTNQYNHTMKTILPQYNIDFKVIERKESGGAPISASRVRKLLINREFEEISRLVPSTTLEYLKNFKY